MTEQEQELIEQLADKEHASWARWMAYLFSKCGRSNGSLYIPESLRMHWQQQIDTPYAELSEREKQSDREEVAHILPIIEEYGGTIADHAVKEIMRTKNPGPIAEPALPDMPNPTPEQIEDPTFLAIWNVIKSWDVNVPEHYVGYCGATGSHVMLIWNALKAIE
jgi:RyR domain.